VGEAWGGERGWSKWKKGRSECCALRERGEGSESSNKIRKKGILEEEKDPEVT